MACHDGRPEAEPHRLAPPHKRRRAESESCQESADSEDPGPELCTTPDTCAALAPALLAEHGVCLVAGALAGDALDVCRERAEENVGEVLRLFLLRQVLGQLGSEQYREINCRDGGRFDIRHKMDRPPFQQLSQDGAWVPAVHQILGPEAELLFCGVLLAQGSSDETSDQAWHTDGGHLFDGVHLPCHCLNVFVPLVDIHEDNGPTQFVLGSHAASFDATGDVSATSLICKAGTAILFDYRILHRGSANLTDVDRPCLYFTYGKPWFRDHKNLRATRSILEPSTADDR